MAEQQQEKSLKNKIKFAKFPLYSNELPIYRQQPNQVYIPCGKFNDYPDYLIYLFNSSGIHNAIVRGKATYIFGKGFKIRKDWQGDKVKLQQVLDNINSYQTAEELTKKSVFDKCLFGGKYYLIEWGAFGLPVSVKQIPYNQVRTNEDRSTFYVSKEWTKEMSTKSKYKKAGNKMPEDVQEYPALNITNKTGKQVLYCYDYNPISEIYPLPEYAPCSTSIETDIEVGFFHLNNVKTGFSAGTMLTIYDDELYQDPAAQTELETALKKKTSGTDNAGEILISVQNSNGKAPTVENLRSNELDKQYEQLDKNVTNKILQGHRISNGLLFGIKVAGELGGSRSEFDLAWEHFTNTYVEPKQEEEEEDINYLLSLYGFTDNPIEIVKLEPLGIELTSEDIKSVLDKDTMQSLVYDKLGLEIPELIKKDDVLTTINSASPLVANKLLDSLTPNEMRSILNLSPIAGGDVIPTPIPSQFKSHKFKDDILIGKFAMIGDSADNYEIVREVGKYENFAEQTDDEKVIEGLKKNKSISISKLSDLTGLSEDNLYKILDRLAAKNIIAVDYVEKGKDVVIDTEKINEPEPSVKLETKWKYAGPKDSKNREFCAKLLSLNKLFTRSDIDNLNNDMEDFNTDVWTYKGGWYHDPARDVNVPQCRHYWSQVIVKRKS